MASKVTNSIFIAGVPRWVKTRQAGERTVTQFSLNHVDKQERKHYFNVSMWNLSEEKIEFLKNTDDVIVVKGSLRYEEYEKDGVKHRTVTISGFDYDTDLKPPANFSGGKQVATKSATAKSQSSEMLNDEFDPFEDEEDNPFGS